MTSILGPCRTDVALRRRCEHLIVERIGLYADDVMRQELGREPTPAQRPIRPRQVIAREALERLPEDQLPTIVVSTPGTGEVAYRDSAGAYAATWILQVTAMTHSTDEQVGDLLASVLSWAAVRVLLDGLPGTSGVMAVRWAGTAAADDGRLDRSQHRSAHLLEVDVADVIGEARGPLPSDWTDPAADRAPVDPGDLPTVQEVGVTTTPTQEIAP